MHDMFMPLMLNVSATSPKVKPRLTGERMAEMKKALLVIVTTLVVALVCAGCSSGQGGSQSASKNQPGLTANVRVPEALPTAQGPQIVSDLEHIYFYYDHPNESIAYGKEGIYCADSNLESATLIFQKDRCDPVCLLGDRLYCNSSTGIESIDLKSHDIVPAADSRSGARSLAPYVIEDSGGGSSAGSKGSMVFATYDDGLRLGDPGADGVLSSKALDGVGDEVLYALTGDGVVYFSCLDDGYQVCSYDVEKGTMKKIASMENEWAFTVVGSDVYFLAEVSGGSADSNGSADLEIMRADAAGNVSSTGVSGKLGSVLYSYGDFVFYMTYIEQAVDNGAAESGKSGNSAKAGKADESKEPLYLGRPSYYDTVSGGSAVIDRAAYDGMNVGLRGVSGGYLYFDGIVVDELTGMESYNVYLDRIDGSGDLVNVDLLTRDAKPTDQVLAWNEAEAQREQEESEKARQEYEESVKNEPYGPGKSKLFLKADDKRSACYRLVRRDGSVEFQVLLAPGEKTTQSFPCGRYTLKIAQGTEWISDEEAFGEKGDYDTTELFNFEAGESYQIGTGTGSNIRNDSQSGFTG